MKKKFFIAACFIIILLAGAAWAAMSYKYPGDLQLTQDEWRELIPPTATDNTVTIDFDSTDGTITHPGYVYGGLSNDVEPKNNKVILEKGNVTNSIYGGYTGGAVIVLDNSVTMKSGSANYAAGGYAWSGGTVSGNIVVIERATVSGWAEGGYSAYGAVTGNSVTMSAGGSVLTIAGGESGYNGSSGKVMRTVGVICRYLSVFNDKSGRYATRELPMNYQI